MTESTKRNLLNKIFKPYVRWYGIKDKCCKDNIFVMDNQYGQCAICKRLFVR